VNEWNFDEISRNFAKILVTKFHESEWTTTKFCQISTKFRIISRNFGDKIFNEISQKKINEISWNFAKFLWRNFYEISRNFAKLNSLSHLFRISRNKKIDFRDHPNYNLLSDPNLKLRIRISRFWIRIKTLWFRIWILRFRISRFRIRINNLKVSDSVPEPLGLKLGDIKLTSALLSSEPLQASS
jgi:hypothetical protein